MCVKIILLLGCLFLVIITAQEEHTPNLAVVLQQMSNKNDTSFNMTCVVSGTSMDSAIAWITELESKANNIQNHVSHYIPARDNSHNCDLDNYEACNIHWTGTTGWTLQNSLENELGPVTDQRWEEFPITPTTGRWNFKTFANIENHQQFKVHFSVRAEEIHLFLCDNNSTYLGNCYWIIINGWGGHTTAIRKCPTYEIPQRANVYPTEPCKTLRHTINHTSYSILNKQEWKHFTVERKSNNIILWEIGNDTPLLNYVDLDDTITTSYLIMNSRFGPGYWKLHEYFYIKTTSEISGSIGPRMYTTESTFCASLFVAMCTKCSLTIDILYYNGTGFEKFKTVPITPKKGMTWQEEKITAELIPQPTTLQLNVSSHCKGCKAKFWALDKFQICSKNEIRTLSITQHGDPISCQAIRYPHKQLTYKSLKPDKATETTCPNGTFGKDCIGCSKVFGSEISNCEKSIICELDSHQQNICQCANGYTGENCLQECPDGFYGFNCKETCGHCSYSPCGYITGHCPLGQCIQNFTGLQCKTAPSPVLQNPPTIFEVKHTSFKVQVKNASYEGLGTPLYYVIQYKEPLQREWTSTDHYHIGYTDPIEVNNLNVLTKYIVRVVLIAENGQRYNSENVVPIVSLQTTCAFIEEKDIIKQVYNTSATLIFVNTPESCKPQDYQLTLDQSNGRIISKELSFEIINLQPVTEYSITIRNRNSDKILNIAFKTQEGASSKVLNLKTLKNDVTGVVVSWDPPRDSNGIIRYYKIQYMHLRHLGCPEQTVTYENDQKLLQEETTTTTLTNLVAYSQYSVKVWAFTIMDGEFATTTTATKQTDEPEKTELPSIKNTEAGSTDVNIFLRQPDCTLIKGPVQYYVALQCSNDWCGQSFITKNIKSISQQALKFPGLFPYSNYKLEVKIGRLNGNIFNGDGITAFFNTTSSVPNRISDLIVYSRTETSISLRFSPPFPPTGEISHYYVTYYYKIRGTWFTGDSAVSNKQMFSPRTCKIWESMHCIVLTKLHSHQFYEILIQAKNIGTEYNQPTEIRVKTEQDTPDPPRNLSAAWDDYYNLTLTWNHPSMTNGPLTKFLISILSTTGQCYKSEFSVNEESYNLTYNYLIPLTGSCYSSKLEVHVAAFDIILGHWANVDNLFSPPKTPSFPITPSVQNATKTTITIKLPKPIDIGNNSWMYIIVSSTTGKSENTNLSKEIQETWKKTGIPKKSFSWIVYKENLAMIEITTDLLVIGNTTKLNSTPLNKELYNRPLKPGTKYIITILLINAFQGIERYSVYKIYTETKLEQQTYYELFSLLLVLLLPILLWFLIRRNKATGNFTNNNLDEIMLTTKNTKRKAVSSAKSQEKAKRTMSVSTDIIGNISRPNYSCLIRLEGYAKYIKDSLWTNDDGELQRQFSIFTKGQLKPAEYGIRTKNSLKNRNQLIIPYDYNRVVLNKLSNDEFSDYINASYIEENGNSKAYIATQYPKKNTINDFWRMVWQENVTVMVLINNSVTSKEEKFQYWPDKYKTNNYGSLKVYHHGTKYFGAYIHRQLQLSTTDEERLVTQLHFSSWPEQSVPLYCQNLIPFLKRISRENNNTAPILIHSNTGTGRTGTIILCDIVLKMARRNRHIDFLASLQNLREQRSNMVSDIQQYKLAHLLLYEILFGQETAIPCDDRFCETARARKILLPETLEYHINYIQNMHWADQVIYSLGSNSPPKPDNKCFSIISRTEIDGFKHPAKYTVIQQPLRHLWSEFWKLIADKDIKAIVCVNEIPPEDEYLLWPTKGTSYMELVKSVRVKCLERTYYANRDVYKIRLHIDNYQKIKTWIKTVNIICMKGWHYNTITSETSRDLVDTWAELDKVSLANDHILVTCLDGVTASGVFVAFCFLIDKIIEENQCDVCFAARMIRRNCQKFIKHKEHLELLSKAAIRYAEDFMTYAEIQ